MKPIARIVRIVRIVDTREYEEGPDDRWYPIRGSGIESRCARCGRMHEVHATVELDDNTTAVVGTGCAGSDDLVSSAQFRSGAAAAKRMNSLRAKEKSLAAKVELLIGAEEKVAGITPPPAVWSEEQWAGGTPRPTVRVGDGYAYAFKMGNELDPRDREERERCALDGWKANRLAEILPQGVSRYGIRTSLREVREQIEKLEERIQKSLSAGR